MYTRVINYTLHAQVRCELLKILEHNNYPSGLHKVREELNQLSFQVKAQARLEQTTAVKQMMYNLPNDKGAFCNCLYSYNYHS